MSDHPTGDPPASDHPRRKHLLSIADLGWREALAADPAAAQAWDRLSYSHQRQHALALARLDGAPASPRARSRAQA